MAPPIHSGLQLLETPLLYRERCLPCGSVGKESSSNAGDTGVTGSIPGLGRSYRGGHGNPLQYSCLENPMDRRAWRAIVHRVTKSWTRLNRLSMHTRIWRGVSSIAKNISGNGHQLDSLTIGDENTSFESYPGSSAGNESACNAGDLGLIPGLGRSPGEGNGNPLQYFCLENSMDRGAWRATVHWVAKSQIQLSD